MRVEGEESGAMDFLAGNFCGTDFDLTRDKSKTIIDTLFLLKIQKMGIVGILASHKANQSAVRSEQLSVSGVDSSSGMLFS